MSEVQPGAAPAAQPAGGAPNPGAQPAAANPPVQQDWRSSLNEELKGYVELKGFKDPVSVVDSYRNIEKLLGAPKERLVKLPEKDDDVAGWNEVHERLGRPKDAKEYKIDVPQGYGDEKFSEWARGKFHELGLSKKQADKLAEGWNKYVSDKMTASQTEYTTKVEQETADLKRKWGAAYDQNIEVAKRGYAAFGLKPEQIDALEKVMGFAGVMEFAHNLGIKTGEGEFVRNNGGNSGFGTLTPSAAQARIDQLRGDATWVAKFASGDADAIAEMNKLSKWAFG